MVSGILLSGAVRATVVLAAGLVATALLSRAAAATRRFVLVLTLGAALFVPVVAAVGPRWAVEAPAALSVLAHESANEVAPRTAVASDLAERALTLPARVAVSSTHRTRNPGDLVILVWLAVATALLVRAAASQLQARAIARRATPITSARWIEAAVHATRGRSVDVRASTELASPAVTGLFSPTIVIPQSALDWTRERCDLVLAHELAHIRRHDVIAQAIAEVACAIHWCNPLVWICARRLRMEREIAADDAVLTAGVRPSRYAEELVAVATSIAAPSAALAMAARSSLEARVVSILASRAARAPIAARGAAAIAVVGTVFATAVACASPQASVSAPAAQPVVPSAVGSANDAAIQRIADEEIAVVEREWAPELATIIVLDPATGEILAHAGHSDGKAADTAWAVAMAPGSTVKPIAIAAALEEHAITADQRFECGPAPRTYAGQTLSDASENGTLDVAHLLAVSSNIGMSHIFDALGGDHLALWLHRFHFGEQPGIPGAAAGAFPRSIVSGSFEGATVAIGEGLTATPLQMVAAYGAIADDGVYHAPTLDRGASTAERVVSPETAHAMMAMLETAVVNETATGRAARVDGVDVAGKTGTSEWTGPDGRDRTYASFIGIADLPARRVVALVGIEAPHTSKALYGGGAAAPVFARLVKRIRGS